MKIANKISFSYLITVVILTFVGTSTFYIVSSDSLKKTTFEHLNTTAVLTASRIESFIKEHKGHISMLSEMKSVKSIIGPSSDAEQVSGIMMKLKEHAKTEYIHELIVLNPEGIVVASLNREDMGRDFNSKIDMSEAMKNVYVGSFHALESGKEIFNMYKPLKDDKTGRLSGILVAGISMDMLNKITREKSGLGETEKIYIVNMDGIMITQPVALKGSRLNQEAGIKTILKNIEKGLLKGKETLIFTDYRGKKVVRTFKYIPQMNWVLLVEVDESEILAHINRLKTIFIIIMLFIPAAAWLIGVFVSRAVTAPINKLHKGIEIIGKGNLDYKVGTSSRDEIGRLSRAFDVMTSDLKKTTTSIDLLNREIAERKKTEEELEVYTHKLEKSNNELEEFAHIASHDLQEPLRKVTGFGSRLKEKCSDVIGEQGLNYIDRMMDAASRMQILINNLLDYSRVTTKARAFTPVNLSAIAREVLSDLEVRIEQTGAKVKLTDLPTIDADALQMRQLFQNLIGNALKFNKKGSPPVVKISGEFNEVEGNDNRAYRITVEDNGIGFDEKYADRIFGIFQRLHGRSEYEGTGIGLSICKKIVERHGGSIKAKSSLGQGTKFIITLPVKQYLQRLKAAKRV